MNNINDLKLFLKLMKLSKVDYNTYSIKDTNLSNFTINPASIQDQNTEVYLYNCLLNDMTFSNLSTLYLFRNQVTLGKNCTVDNCIFSNCSDNISTGRIKFNPQALIKNSKFINCNFYLYPPTLGGDTAEFIDCDLRGYYTFDSNNTDYTVIFDHSRISSLAEINCKSITVIIKNSNKANDCLRAVVSASSGPANPLTKYVIKFINCTDNTPVIITHGMLKYHNVVLDFTASPTMQFTIHKDIQADDLPYIRYIRSLEDDTTVMKLLYPISEYDDIFMADSILNKIFIELNFSNFNLEGFKFLNVTFDSCNLNNASFIDSTFTECTFINCSINDKTDFGYCDFNGNIIFKKCNDISSARFYKARFYGLVCCPSTMHDIISSMLLPSATVSNDYRLGVYEWKCCSIPGCEGDLIYLPPVQFLDEDGNVSYVGEHINFTNQIPHPAFLSSADGPSPNALINEFDSNKLNESSNFKSVSKTSILHICPIILLPKRTPIILDGRPAIFWDAVMQDKFTAFNLEWLKLYNGAAVSLREDWYAPFNSTNNAEADYAHSSIRLQLLNSNIGKAVAAAWQQYGK